MQSIIKALLQIKSLRVVINFSIKRGNFSGWEPKYLIFILSRLKYKLLARKNEQDAAHSNLKHQKTQSTTVLIGFKTIKSAEYLNISLICFPGPSAP